MIETILFGVLGCILALIALGVLLDFGATELIREGKVDRRFKSNWKDNRPPVYRQREPAPFLARLSIALALAFLAWVCFDKELRAHWPYIWRIAACVFVGALTWNAYPSFYSRYRRNTTSDIRFAWLRSMMTLFFMAVVAPITFALLLPIQRSASDETVAVSMPAAVTATSQVTSLDNSTALAPASAAPISEPSKRLHRQPPAVSVEVETISDTWRISHDVVGTGANSNSLCLLNRSQNGTAQWVAMSKEDAGADCAEEVFFDRRTKTIHLAFAGALSSEEYICSADLRFPGRHPCMSAFFTAPDRSSEKRRLDRQLLWRALSESGALQQMN